MMQRSLASFLGLFVVAFIALAQTPSAPSQLLILSSQGGGASGGGDPPAEGEWVSKDAHYICASASGANNGTDWTNAYTSIPASLTRDDVYYFCEGSYGSYTFDDATNGTQKVYLVKATTTDHGTETGYSAGIVDGQTSFGTITAARGYLHMSGQSRTESYEWAAPAGYGFRASSVRANSLESEVAAGSVFEYIDIGGAWETNPSDATIDAYGNPIYLVYNQSNVTFSRCAVHNGKGALVFAHGSDGLVFDHCHFSWGWGKEAIAGPNVGIDNLVVRYSRFWNSTITDPNDETSGITAEIGAFGNDVSNSGCEIYGNVFYGTISGARNSVIMLGDPSFMNSTVTNCKVFNNTFAGFPENSVYSEILLYGGSGNEARNNLFYDTEDNSVTANAVSNNVTAMSDPFVDYAGLDFRLSGAVGGGTTLSAPYDVDPDGNAYGTEVGAYAAP